MVEAKAKARRRREQAIRDFKAWKEAHPRAKLARQIQVFDMLVDSSMPPDPPRKKRNAPTPA